MGGRGFVAHRGARGGPLTPAAGAAGAAGDATADTEGLAPTRFRGYPGISTDGKKTLRSILTSEVFPVPPVDFQFSIFGFVMSTL